MENAITKNKTELERLEGIIQQNIGAFYEVGRALMAIRDDELYKIKNGGAYQTFEVYCKEIWDIARRTAYQYIEAVQVADNVRNCAQPPLIESQTRPLAHLEPDQQREAWQKAIDTAPDGKVTAAHVQKVVRDMEPPKPYILKPHEPINSTDEDSDSLFHLKRWWKRATKKDKKIFLTWIEEDGK